MHGNESCHCCPHSARESAMSFLEQDQMLILHTLLTQNRDYCQVKVELSVLRKELKELFDGLSLPVSTSIVYVCIHWFISTVVLACVAICCCSIDGLYTHMLCTYHIGCK